jgi:tetratricopeptide (TPR) repeat protein
MHFKTNLSKLFCLFISASCLLTLMYSCNNSEKNTDPKTTADSTVEKNTAQESKLLNIIANNKDSLLPKENLIQFYRTSNQYDKAISTVNSYLSKDTTNLRLLRIKSILLLEKPDTLAAISNLEKTISIYPSALDIIMLGAIYANQSNEKSMLLANILLRDFNDIAIAEAYFIKGSYYSNTGNKKAAIDMFDNCINHTITFMEAYREKALALAALKKYNEAIYTLNKALTLNNNYPEGYFYLGEILEKTNNTDGAIEAYQKALLYDTGYIEASNAIERLKK